MKVSIQTVLACAGFLMATCGHVYAGLITVTSQSTEAYAGTDAPSVDFASAFYTGTALDGVDHAVTAVHAVGSYTTTVNLGEQPPGTTLSYDFGGSTSDLAGAAYGAFGLSLAVVKFTANSDNLSYSLSGNYSYANASSDPNNVYANFGVFLLDQTANAVVFRNVQSALGTLAFDMTVGGTFQDVVGGPPELEGSLSGALINGHVYEFSYTADTRYGTVDSSGNVLLTITSEASAVPEPASLMLCGLGTIGLIAGGLRRRCRAV